MMLLHRDERWSLSDLETLYLLALISMRKAPKIFEVGSALNKTVLEQQNFSLKLAGITIFTDTALLRHGVVQ